jgi:hypothetical protein
MSAPRVPGGNPADPFPIVNEALDILAHQQVYAWDPDTTSGLTLGYLGGMWGGFTVVDGTLTLTDDDVNYVVVARATGVISDSVVITNWNNLTDYARVWELETVAGHIITPFSEGDYRGGPGGVHGQGEGAGPGSAPIQCIPIACSDETSALTAGAAKVTFRMPYAFTLTEVRASVTTAPTGANLVVDINENGSTILSTKLSIDATEKTSTTAATPPVISDTSLADDAEITVDIDQIGSTLAGAGLKVYLIGTKT